ncbi:hypothetical protein A2415_03285 [candidate division WWE3 bacterium RIFOXYC1_FULL_39_7]|uniref:LytR/CpsA/Psr regulator C-terminal domain-containing protein n=2 Tax=Katanobacteria TaxID=422282 RepID=A0A1F4X5E0_UNCKA|nr:MAG: hypothetical protein A2415_03285 [candidate division WWE3 bacterium RIFOXYC1_FULL_39_7]OGC76353.1 MAG: hypothetical protein A2619_00125 [candidate division WWE3 bacterium RIFOXYD1_FULL_39_9]
MAEIKKSTRKKVLTTKKTPVKRVRVAKKALDVAPVAKIETPVPQVENTINHLPDLTKINPEPVETVQTLQMDNQSVTAAAQPKTAKVIKPIDFLNIIFAGLLMIVGLAVLFSSIYIFYLCVTKQNGLTPTTNTNPVIVEEVKESSETLSAPVDRTLFKITILNGSGIPGEAARTQKLLENERFVVESIGNADRIDYKSTEIIVGSKVPLEFTLDLMNELGKNFLLLSEIQFDESETGVTIIVGSTPSITATN